MPRIATIALAAAQAAQDSGGYVPIDTATLDTVSGKGLLIAAYAIILGSLLAYALSLVARERAVAREADAIQSGQQANASSSPASQRPQQH